MAKITVESTDLTYRLTATEMIEETAWLPYALSREAAAAAVRLRPGADSISVVYNTVNENTGFRSNWHADVHRFKGGVKIGCQRFIGRNFTTLRKWALHVR